jgi:hypothetical protein
VPGFVAAPAARDRIELTAGNVLSVPN